MMQRREPLVLSDDFGEWTPITVHLTGEISPRNRTDPYKGSMFAVHPGDIVFSKIDARSGAIGVLPSKIGKAVVTPEFPVFMAHPERLDAEFMRLVLRTGNFLAALKRKASGTSGRKRVTPDAFQDLRIPLPPVDAQRSIVADYRVAMARAAGMEREATDIETRAAQDFETALGFPPPVPLPDRPVFIARFSEIDRWSHDGILRRIVGGDTTHDLPWPVVRLGEVIADLENGWSPKALNRPAEGEEWGVLKLGAVSFGTFDEGQNKALPPSLTPRPSLQIQSGDLLISRANVTRLVGATALVEDTRDQLLLCDKIFRAIPSDARIVDFRFLARVLRIGDVRLQIEANVTGTSPTMKNISKPALLNLTFPLPPLPDQEAMVAALNDAHARATVLRTDAEAVRSAAWEAFEAAVYAPEDDA